MGDAFPAQRGRSPFRLGLLVIRPRCAAEEAQKAVAAGSNAFALDLYGRLRASEKGNLFFSPYSLSSA